MDLLYQGKINYTESRFKKWATQSTKSKGRKLVLLEDPFRTPFERDCHRIIHSLPFRRLKHKTQVFYSPRNDHICTRLEHSLHVSSISSTICNRLDLNSTLAEAIALSHDLGHPPFGHQGEIAVNLVHTQYNKSHKDDKLPYFSHEAQSLHIIDTFKNSMHEILNLTFEVRDGVVCHCGEKYEQKITPQYKKKLKLVDVSSAGKQFPGTIEGCVVRMADSISYLGRDFEDGTMAQLITSELPTSITRVLGDTNSKIIGTLVNDLVSNSEDNNFLEYSDEVYAAMKEMKLFNYEKIYHHPKILSQKERIYLILNELFNYFLDILEDKTKYSKIESAEYPNESFRIFAEFLNDMNYSEHSSKGKITSDFIVGMTDNFAMHCFNSLFNIESVV